jgi:hypothetical protein
MRFNVQINIFLLIWVTISVANTSSTTVNNTLTARTLIDSTVITSCNDGICEVSETSNTCPQDCSKLLLSGTNAGVRGAQGVMFEMRAKRDVTIKSFSFYTDAARTGVIEVYTRIGSYGGKELVASGWSLIYGKTVNQNGRDVLTQLGSFDTGVTIPANSTQSFYIVTANYIMYDAGSLEWDALSEDTSLILYQGSVTAASWLLCFVLTSPTILCATRFAGKGISGSAFPGAGTSGVLWSPRNFKGTIR